MKTQTRRLPRRKYTRRTHSGGNKSDKSAQMNCSPAVSSQKASQHTCYTVEMLNLIRESYNKSHKPHEYIPWSNPDEIWRTLHSRLVNCEKEDCWLAVIKDTDLRKNIDELVFAPKQPEEWKTNKNEWLTDLDIRKVMSQYEKTYPNFTFIGPSPIDFDARVNANKLYWSKGSGTVCVWEELCKMDISKLAKRGIDKIGMVFNLDRHDQPGSHWVSLFVDLDKSHPFVFYFDSVGNPPPAEIKTLMARIIKQSKRVLHRKIHTYTNTNHEHQKSNTECGMYALFFNITLLTGDSGFETNLDLDNRIRLFKDAKIPDKYVEFYRKKYFNE